MRRSLATLMQEKEQQVLVLEKKLEDTQRKNRKHRSPKGVFEEAVRKSALDTLEEIRGTHEVTGFSKEA